MSLPFSFLFFTFIFSLVSIYIILRLTRRFDIYDRVDDRKVHTGNIPRLGGVGIFLGFLVGMILFFRSAGHASYVGTRLWVILVSSSLIFVMGVWDDLKPWRARYKLLVQIVAAVMVIASGFTFTRLGFGNSSFGLDLGLFAYPLTFFWIVGVTNAINLIDGIDGLSGSVSLFAVIAYAFFFYFVGNAAAFYSCAILALSIVGFLCFNLPFPRAKIFMGDGGSQFLGFILAVLPLLQSGNNLATISLPYACAVLSIPICDTIAAIWRRLREKRRIDDPDRFHLHHKLMMLGFSAREALVVLVVLQSIIVTLTVTSAKVPMILSFFLLLCVYALVLLFFTVIHIKKEEELERRNALVD